MTHLIAVSNQKGGVAKTTSCMSLGGCLAEQGRPTLMVDLDPQAHLTLAAGLKAEDLPWTVADLLGDETQEPGAALKSCRTLLPGLDLLPSDMRLASLEREFYRQPDYEVTLAQRLVPWMGRYDFVLLDCPPSLGALTLMALTAAQTVLVPVQCEYFSTNAVFQLLEIVEAVKSRTNPDLETALFVTLYDGRNLVSRSVLAQLRSHFEGQLFETLIQMDTRLRESAIAGEPVTAYAPKTRASDQYRSLANEFLARIENGGFPG